MEVRIVLVQCAVLTIQAATYSFPMSLAGLEKAGYWSLRRLQPAGHTSTDAFSCRRACRVPVGPSVGLMGSQPEALSKECVPIP